jgi:hypothetical protein
MRNRLAFRGAAVVALLLLLGGCYKATFVRDVPAAGPTQSTWTNFFVFGIAGTAEIDIREFCPSGDVRLVRTGSNFGTGLVTVLTIGLYAPRKVWVQCAATGHAEVATVINGASLDDFDGESIAVQLRAGDKPGHWVATWRGEEMP